MEGQTHPSISGEELQPLPPVTLVAHQDTTTGGSLISASQQRKISQDAQQLDKLKFDDVRRPLVETTSNDANSVIRQELHPIDPVLPDHSGSSPGEQGITVAPHNSDSHYSSMEELTTSNIGLEQRVASVDGDGFSRPTGPAAKSWVWSWFTKNEGLARCDICFKVIKCDRSRSTQATHLVNQHGIRPPSLSASAKATRCFY
ncbi:hypothetical protein BIW11_11877 [Tropilaelaps mercedesae]|uniref:BED-type domain-containing protein n=1 Tax=Tropilaelaps mercedesae TaxID=418985 RepID=A0A1V9X940_9ACAR|nr:hypothetical protein BIW11_11877 [Tropilaelaps mercedesae]